MDEPKVPGPKNKMGDEERLALAAKLDQELDEFIGGLERRQYTEGWPEDRWEEEMDKHPFFMKEAPKPGDEVHPLLEGIQQLKYDPDENTAEELAVSYKEDGNFNFKHKNYRMAILSYTEGIKQKHENLELSANLLNNRAASHFFLKNYRSALRDCTQVLKLQPKYAKAQIRAAKCCFELQKYEPCLEFCDTILELKPEDIETLALRQKAVNAMKSHEKELRRQRKLELKLLKDNNEVLKELKARQLQFDTPRLNLYDLEPKLPELAGHRVHLNMETKELSWPVVLMYPEFKTMDFIQRFLENTRIEDQLAEVLAEPAHWDPHHLYKINSINIYYEIDDKKLPHKVNIHSTLLAVLKEPKYIIKSGTPSFIVLVKNSDAEKSFLTSYVQ